MPFYDGDMVNLLTPDGRAVTMPSGLAANFPGLLPPPAQVVDPGVAAAPAPVPIPAPPAVPAPASRGPQEGPITDPSQLPMGAGAPAAPQGPVTSPAEDPGVPRRPAPEPSPTKAQLIKEGPAGTLAAQNAAIDKQQAAVDRSAQVEADAATQEGHAMAQRDEQTKQILVERARQAQANEAELNARIQSRDQLAAQIAKTRIDRSVDHPIWAQIGLVLSMVGTAMTRRPGEAWNDPAYNTLQQLLDKKVAGQMADLDQKRLALAQMNIGVTEQRQHNVDRLTEIDARKDAAIQQAQQAVNTIATQMKSPAALAGAQQLNAKLEETRADLRGQAAQRYQDQLNTEAARAQTLSMHRESLGMQYTIHKETLAATEREKMAEISARLLAEGKSGAAAKAKLVAEGGLFDPRSRDPLLNPSGQAKFKQADSIESATRENPYAGGMSYVQDLRARASTDEEKKQVDAIEARVRTDPNFAAQAGQQYAKNLRDDARVNDAIVVDPKVATPLREHIGTAQNVTDQIDTAMAALEQDPSAFNREQWAGIATQLGNLANTYQKTIGERISVKAFDQTMKHILEFDPDSYFHREFNQSRALESLKKLKDIVAGNVNIELGKEGIKTDWKPLTKRDTGTQLDIDDKTAAEEARGTSDGVFSRIGNMIRADADAIRGGGQGGWDRWNKIASGDADREATYSAAAARPGSEAGLSPIATTRIKALAQKAAAASDSEHDTIVQQFASHVSDGLNEDSRRDVATGILEVLRNSNPAVYRDVVAALPETDRKEVRELDKHIRKATNVPRVPSRFDPDAAEEADAAARRAAAFAPFQAGAPLSNSPGAGPALGLRTNR